MDSNFWVVISPCWKLLIELPSRHLLVDPPTFTATGWPAVSAATNWPAVSAIALAAVGWPEFAFEGQPAFVGSNWLVKRMRHPLVMLSWKGCLLLASALLTTSLTSLFSVSEVSVARLCFDGDFFSHVQHRTGCSSCELFGSIRDLDVSCSSFRILELKAGLSTP